MDVHYHACHFSAVFPSIHTYATNDTLTGSRRTVLFVDSVQYPHVVVFVTQHSKSKAGTTRSTFAIPADILKELDLLKSASGARNRDEVIKDAVHTTYQLARGLSRAARQVLQGSLVDEADFQKVDFQQLQPLFESQDTFSESSRKELFDMLNRELSKYWLPLTKMLS